MESSLARVFEGIDLDAYRDSAAYRRAACELNPLLFAVTYLKHHITDPLTGKVSFAECHFEWAEHAKLKARTGTRKPGENRRIYVAPRNAGKSTWHTLILPLWAGANKHSKFMVMFSATDEQARQHLESMRQEFNANELLRHDFPEFCAPASFGRKTEAKLNSVVDKANKRKCGNGWVVMARGINSQTLGLKVGNQRPTDIVLDDTEDDEANYSAYLAEKRLNSVLQSILPLSRTADVTMIGTVTLYGSIIHQAVRHNLGEEKFDWITDNKFRIHHALPILENEDGTERSMWPENPIFELDYLNSIRHTREYILQMANMPNEVSGMYWSPSDIRYGTFDCKGGTYISVDPIVTQGSEKSDLCGVSVIGCANPVRDDAGNQVHPRRALVKFAAGVRHTGRELANYVAGLIEVFPEATVLLVETNQGGDLWEEVFEDLPIKVIAFKNHRKKDERIASLLKLYQTRPEPLILHSEKHHQLEAEMMTYPNGKYDDITDSVAHAALRWVSPERKIRVRKGSITPR